MYVSESTAPKLIKLTQEDNIVTLAPNSENSTVTMGVGSVELAPPEPNVPTPVLEVLQEEGHEIIPKGFTNVKVDEVQQSYLKKDNIRSELASKQRGSSHQTLDSAKGASNSDLILDSNVSDDRTVAVEGEDNSNEEHNISGNLCKECGKTFSSKSNLTRHWHIHREEKTYACAVCEKKFYRDTHLQDHIRSHTGEKPFKCTLCDKKFSTKSILSTHSKSHEGNKPYPCELCHISFSRKQHLQNHARTHTGERSFKCDECDKKYTTKQNLDKHIKNKHGGKK